jgi:hypothetical protein
VAEDDASLSKRQRQKQRRQQKMEAQRAAQRAARRKRLAAIGVVVALLVGATGAFAYGWVSDRLEERQLIAEAEERLGDFGCSEIEEEAILPSQHLASEELAANPPDVLYPRRPATSGRHLAGVVQTGVYDKVIDERLLVHNLEHGYVHVYYDEDAPEDQVAELQAFAQEQIDSGRYEKLIVAPWKAELEDDANFALTAWGARQHCRDFDEGVALAFLREYHYLAGNAPEREIQPHLAEGLDPDAEEGDVLFPPLDEDGVEDVEDAMEEPEEAEEQDS